jgi:hypothetical protein
MSSQPATDAAAQHAHVKTDGENKEFMKEMTSADYYFDSYSHFGNAWLGTTRL